MLRILLLAPLVPGGFVHGLVDGFRRQGYVCDTRPAADRSKVNTQQWVDEVVSASKEYDTVFISKGGTIDMPYFTELVSRVADTTYFDMDPTSGNGCGPSKRPKQIGARGIQCTRIICTGTEACRWFRQNGFEGRIGQIYEGYRPWLWEPGAGNRAQPERLCFVGTPGYQGDGGRKEKIKAIQQAGYDLLLSNNVHYQECANVYWNSGICMNFVCGDITSLRLMHILASGGFALTEKNMDVEASFESGKQLDWFDFQDTEGMLDKIHFYLKNPTLRDTIAANGHNLSKEYTWELQARKMAKFIQGAHMCDGGAGEFVS